MGWRHYWPMARRLRDTGLACVGAGANEVDSGQDLMPPRTLGCHGLVFVTAGTGRFGDGAVTDRSPADFRAPAVLWLFPGIPHQYGPGPGGWEESWVLFDGIATAGYAALGVGDPACPVTSADMLPPEVAVTFAALRAAATRPGRQSQVVAASLAHRLVGIAAELSHPSDRTARSLVEMVAADSAENLTIAQRARRSGVSTAELRAQVLAETGLTPHELVLRTRIARAQLLLTRSDLGVAQIAAQVGYDDPAYFSRFFRNRVGLSPQDFRRLP